MPLTKQPNVEPLAGYRLIAPLGSGGFGEVWKCEAPGGILKAIKFVHGDLDGVNASSTQAHEELCAIQHIKDLRHPFLLALDRVESVDGELMIVTELADKNLHEVLLECQAKGQPGIPRDELLHYLGEAAEVLDLINTRHGLQHLDVKPRNLFLVGHHAKVADFGLVTSLASNGMGVKLGAVTPLYAAPEVFQGKVSRGSDQYSLACCYVELLTGRLPFTGQNSRQLLLQHVNGKPDLSRLPEADQPIVAQALAKEPSQRHSSCLEFILALQHCGSRGNSDTEADMLLPASGIFSIHRGVSAATAGAPNAALTETPHSKKLTDIDLARLLKSAAPVCTRAEELQTVIDDLLANTSGAATATDRFGTPQLSESGEELCYRILLGLPPRTARDKVDAFRRQCGGRPIHEDEQSSTFHIAAPSNIWLQWVGRQPGLEVQVRFVPPEGPMETPIEVLVTIKAVRCNKRKGLELVQQLGANLLEGMLRYLLANHEKRSHDRLPWPHPVEVRTIEDDGSLGPAVVCRGKDISQLGIGFHVPHKLPTSQVIIHLLESPRSVRLTIPATLVRAQPGKDGWYEVGALFQLAAMAQSEK